MYTANWFISLFIFFIILQFCYSKNTITAKDNLKDGDIVVSNGQVFALGFFSPGNSKNRYVGIWYNQVQEKTVVWVANRSNPINDTSGRLTITGAGNLVLFEKNQTVPVWSTNISVKSGGGGVIAQLFDSGNLVLGYNDREGDGYLWQSFDYPTNTMLPFLKLGLDYRTGLNRFLTSWKSPDDPGTGNWSYRIDPTGFPQLSLYRGPDRWWRSGSWTGEKWSGVPQMTKNYIFNVSFVNDQNQTSVVYGVTVPKILTRMVINETGFMQRFTWNPNNSQWIGFWSSPKDNCDYYGHCGKNSNCDPENPEKYECTCLPGFEPKSPQEWYLRDGSSGCIRKDKVSVCKSREGFVKVASVKVPDTSIVHVDMNLSLKMCEKKCLNNCSCMAYASAYVYEDKTMVGCLNWHGDLIDTRTYSNSGQDLFVRVDADELARYVDKGSLNKKGLLAILIVSIVAVILLVTLVFWLVIKKKRRGKRRTSSKYSSNYSTEFLEDSQSIMELDESKSGLDLPLFDLKSIALATDGFSANNKLGEGGFGPVYKGVLPNGIEIAVKRLSKHSGQGIEELKNEIALLAKLQHRNLVRILGCCINKAEKMLIYEYLDNKSLDTFIFDETKRSCLDWNKRFEIILGIARGILYLHQDSRLRIIHRDLKASNVLLDSAMNPKISDFGMARIFGGDQIEANTNRVVGTYGYMSPEYAMDGTFSIKSDVYSFGVLVLEIVTGRKNSGHYPDSPSSNLVGHVWDLWREGKASETIDSSLGESCPRNEVLRCIEIGLLCVQEHATDRPTMSAIVSMLSNDMSLTTPRRPAFIMKRKFSHADSSTTGTSTEGCNSVNDVTVTMVQGR